MHKAIEDTIELTIGWLLVGIVLALFLNYVLEYSIDRAIKFGLIISAIAIVGHELAHMFAATQVCRFPRVEFTLTSFAIEMSLFSIFVLIILIYLKSIGWFETRFIPIIASPGAVLVDRLRQSKCGDTVAAAGIILNFITGIIALLALSTLTIPPFILNSPNDAIALLSLLALLSFALAFFNALPLRAGNLMFDGYHVLKIDPLDARFKVLVVAILGISAVMLWGTGWWAIQIGG